MKKIFPSCLVAAVVLGWIANTPSAMASDGKAPAAKVVKVGGVAYSPESVVVFRNLCNYLNANGLKADFVLYSNYDSQVRALEKGEIDIAWNTPMAHAQYHAKKGGSKTLAMRDIDCRLRSVVVVRKDAKIENLSDLEGKTLVLGSREAAEATVLPLHYLGKEKVKLDRVKTLKLDEEMDFRGNPCGSPNQVLEAVVKGRGQAGIIPETLWNRVSKSDRGADLAAVWTTPEFSHCVFTAPANFDDAAAKKFTDLMIKMTPEHEGCADVLRIEGAKRWVPSSPEGFQDLVDALVKASAK